MPIYHSHQLSRHDSERRSCLTTIADTSCVIPLALVPSSLIGRVHTLELTWSVEDNFQFLVRVLSSLVIIGKCVYKAKIRTSVEEVINVEDPVDHSRQGSGFEDMAR